MIFTKMGTDMRFLITFDHSTLVITLFSERNLKRLALVSVFSLFFQFLLHFDIQIWAGNTKYDKREQWNWITPAIERIGAF